MMFSGLFAAPMSDHSSSAPHAGAASSCCLLPGDPGDARRYPPAAEGAAPQPVLLHSCCAPCSSAILEWMRGHGFAPTVFYFNPNIFPEAEYLVRKRECQRYCEKLGVPFIDADYDHARWREAVRGLESAPERGPRCRVCFGVRLLAAAQAARSLGIELFTTTLAGSRWKRLDQIRDAAAEAERLVPGVRYWDMNWRKGGLQNRRGELLKTEGFYNQLWCGCEFSMGHLKARPAEELPAYVRSFVASLPDPSGGAAHGSDRSGSPAGL